MKIEKIKPIPKYILKLIEKKDKEDCTAQNGIKRFYSYLTKNDGELVKITVAVRNRYGQWHCKQVAVHGVDSDISFSKDLNFFYTGGYTVGWWEEGFYKHCKWWEGDGWCVYNDNELDPYAPCVNLEYALTFNKYKYSAVDKYTYMDILKYLRLYEKYPQMEYLVKLGLSSIATSKQILKLCSKEKKFRKWLSINAEKIAKNHYYISTLITSYTKGIDFDEVQAIESAKKVLNAGKYYKEIRDEFKGETLKFLAYLGKHKTSISNYHDYYKACKYLQLDMADTKHRYPIDFKHWHDTRIDEYRTKLAKENLEKKKELNEKFGIVASKFLGLERHRKEPFVVVIAKDISELVKEGQSLHHCVGSGCYDQKFVREETLIFFVRRVGEIDTPYVTVEYSVENKKILQCYGNHNSKPEDETLDFINNKWLPYANRKISRLVA